MGRSRVWWVGIVVVLAVALVWGWKARSGSKPPKYRTLTIEQGAIETTVSATGTIKPVEQVQVGSQVSGTVSRLFADYNSRVRRGQALLQLEPSSFHARELQAEAGVSRAEAALADARNGYQRAQDLFPQNYISKAELQTAEANVQQRAADLKQAHATLAAAQVDLKNTTILAPIDGVVISRSVDLGQTVAASLQAPQLFVIANDLAQMQVETRIDEADIGRVHPGLPVTFTVDAFPDVTFHGQVAQVRLEPITEQGVVTYTTVIRTENPDLQLRPGMTANVTVLVAHHDDVLKVPNAALRFHPAGARGERGGGAMAATMGGRGNGPGGPSAGAAPGGAGGDRAAWRGRGAGGGGGAAGPGGWKGRGMGGARGMAAGRGPGGPQGAGAGPGADPRAGGELDPGAQAFKPGAVFVLRGEKPARVPVMTGITDGAFTEIRSAELKGGDAVIVGLEIAAPSANSTMQPPPGMGGPRFMGPGGGGRRPGGGGGGR